MWLADGGTYDAVPVQLANRALAKMLLCSCDVSARWQVRDDLLSGPSAVAQLHVRVGEAPLQVGDDAIVGRRGAKVAWVVQVDLLVRPADDWAAFAVRRDRLALGEARPTVLALCDGTVGEARQSREGEGRLEKLHG